MRRIVAVLGVLVVAGCGGGGPSLSESFCSDLAAGMSPTQILLPLVDDGTLSPQKAADRAYGMAAVSCPEQLQTNEPLRQYLANWGIDPDAG